MNDKPEFNSIETSPLLKTHLVLSDVFREQLTPQDVANLEEFIEQVVYRTIVAALAPLTPAKKETAVLVDLPNIINSFAFYGRNTLGKEEYDFFLPIMLTYLLNKYVYLPYPGAAVSVFSTPKYYIINKHVLFLKKYHKIDLVEYREPIKGTGLWEDVDLQIVKALNILKQTQFDHLIFMGGDHRYAPHLQHLKENGIKVEMVCHEASVPRYYYNLAAGGCRLHTFSNPELKEIDTNDK